jgi:hypothetical protein
MVKFRKTSRGPHQWLVRPLSGIFVSGQGEVSRYLLVGYSNPKSTGLPNHLIYAIPLYHFRPDPDADTDLRACIDPQTAIPLLRGLYWKNGDLQYDLERDRARFWEPVEKCLQEPMPAPHSQCHEPADAARTGPTQQTFDGITYIDSLTACLRWWAQEKEVLQNAIPD